ncbi:nucleotidyltransferase [filamentous cyanobacterium CCP2]|nr:nucleotidyltransferase [filamentous cyanobacterium CCP2]
MNSPTQTLTAEIVLQTLREQPQLFETFQIKSLALFGSVARNQATTASDLDFLVEFDADPTLILYMNLKFFLEDLFQRKVDLVIKTDIKPQIRETVIQEAIYVA